MLKGVLYKDSDKLWKVKYSAENGRSLITDVSIWQSKYLTMKKHANMIVNYSIVVIDNNEYAIIFIGLPKEILVFESDEFGIHDSGMSKIAYYYYGAERGKGYGLMKNSYGIPTLDMFGDKLTIKEIEFYIDKFISFAKKKKNKIFYLPKIGIEKYGLTINESISLMNTEFPKNVILL